MVSKHRSIQSFASFGTPWYTPCTAVSMACAEPSTATRLSRSTGNVGTGGGEPETLEELEELEELVFCLLGSFSVVETGTCLLLVGDRYEEVDFKSTSHCSPFAYLTTCVVFLSTVVPEITVHVYHLSGC